MSDHIYIKDKQISVFTYDTETHHQIPFISKTFLIPFLIGNIYSPKIDSILYLTNRTRKVVANNLALSKPIISLGIKWTNKWISIDKININNLEIKKINAFNFLKIIKAVLSEYGLYHILGLTGLSEIYISDDYRAARIKDLSNVNFMVKRKKEYRDKLIHKELNYVTLSLLKIININNVNISPNKLVVVLKKIFKYNNVNEIIGLLSNLINRNYSSIKCYNITDTSINNLNFDFDNIINKANLNHSTILRKALNVEYEDDYYYDVISLIIYSLFGSKYISDEDLIFMKDIKHQYIREFFSNIYNDVTSDIIEDINNKLGITKKINKPIIIDLL